MAMVLLVGQCCLGTKQTLTIGRNEARGLSVRIINLSSFSRKVDAVSGDRNWHGWQNSL